MHAREEPLEIVETFDRETSEIMGLLAHCLPGATHQLKEGGENVASRIAGSFGVRRPKAENLLPPYASYSSWVRLLGALAVSLPLVLDEPHLADLTFAPSSSIKPLRSALRFLGLVGKDDRPTERLGRLVEALRLGGTAKLELLREMVYQSYHPIFSPDFDLKSATIDKLKLYFSMIGARGQIRQKCSSFFLNLARDAGLELPPQLLSRAPMALARRRAAPATSRASGPRVRPLSLERRPSPLGPSKEPGLLRDVFPMFDIDWPEEKKQRWFKDFATLIKIYERDEECRVG